VGRIRVQCRAFIFAASKFRGLVPLIIMSSLQTEDAICGGHIYLSVYDQLLIREQVSL
jgi:hypothetical protein